MPDYSMTKVTDEQMIVPASNTNRPGAKLVLGKVVKEKVLRDGAASWVTIHMTGNKKRGATARMHAKFLIEQQGGPDQVSFHAGCDRIETIQYLPWDEVAYHAGDGTGNGNFDSIAIEVCVDEWPMGRRETLRNLTKLVRALMLLFDIPLWRVVQHNAWSGKNCPEQLRENGQELWKLFVGSLALPIPIVPLPDPLLDPTPLPVVVLPIVPQGPVFFPETQHYISHGFKDLWFKTEYGLFVFGYPISEEESVVGPDGKKLVIQFFENGVMEWQEGTQPRCGAVGRRYLEAVGPDKWL